MVSLPDEEFDFRCSECGKNFEVDLKGPREVECPKCKTGWKIELGKMFIKVLKKTE